MIIVSGDRKHPVIRATGKLNRRFPKTKAFIAVSLWDGYPFQVRIQKTPSQIGKEVSRYK